MTKPISKRALVKLISFTISAIILLASAGFAGFNLVLRYKNTIEYTYQNALNQLSDHLTDLRNTLTKGMYANTVSCKNEVYTKLIVSSQQAKSALSLLPISLGDEEKIQKYLSHISDVASYLQKKYLSSASLTNEDENMLISLRGYCDELAVTVEDMALFYTNYASPISVELSPEGNISSVISTEYENNLDGSFRNISAEFTNYPTLIYDGPFSDHILQQKAKLTENKKEYSEDEAKYRAAYFLNVDHIELKCTNRTDGNLPRYFFTNKNRNIIISVTVNGGYVESFYKTASHSEDKLNYDKALIRAESFLKEKKYDNMKVSYGHISNGVAEFNFSYVLDGVVCYGDLIKVGVALDNGEIVNFSATGYIMNHYKRKLPDESLTLMQAASNLSDYLKIKSENIALIPTDGNNEILCYEFLCEGQENDKVLVYINASTGMEENIYILIEDENGILAI